MSARRLSISLGLLAAALLILSLATDSTSADDQTDEALSNPFLGDADAIADGRRIYRMRCVICHAHAGARGPDLFSSRLTDEQFLETVINGRKGTQMPAFGLRLSPDDVWHVHAYIQSTDHYE
jgi:mono/diheme cytochrome c family protein